MLGDYTFYVAKDFSTFKKGQRLFADAQDPKVREDLRIGNIELWDERKVAAPMPIPPSPLAAQIELKKTEKVAEFLTQEAFDTILGSGTTDYGTVLRELRWNPKAQQKVALITTSGTAGGYLDPTHTVVSVPRFGERAFIRPGARVIPCASIEQIRPRWKATGNATGSSYAFGGLAMNFVEENSERPLSLPSYSATAMKLNILGAVVVVNNGWRSDAARWGDFEIRRHARLEASEE